MRDNMATSTIVLFTTVLVCVFHQIAGQHLGGPFPGSGRYRDPDVEEYYRRLCRRILPCGFEDVCERRVYPCQIPPCPVEPYCQSTPGASMKQGNCPRNIRGRQGRRLDVQCNTDYGCSGNLLCCHGYRFSRCSRPLRNDYDRTY